MKVISLRNGQLQSFSETGRVMLDIYTYAHLLNDDVLLEQVREDFTNLGMPFVYVTEVTNIPQDSKFHEAMVEQGVCFSRWGSATIEGKTYFGFADLGELAYARMLM